jgi:hypothetical protein
VDAFGTDEVTFITLLKGNWFLGILLSHKPFLLDRCTVSGSLVGIPRWLPVDCFEALHSALQARKQMCSYLSLVHESLQRFDLVFWCFGTVLRNLTAYQMMRLRWVSSQVPVNAWNRSPPYPIWGLKSFIGPFQPTPIFRLLSRLRTPLGRYLGGVGSSPLLAKVALSA